MENVEFQQVEMPADAGQVEQQQSQSLQEQNEIDHWVGKRLEAARQDWEKQNAAALELANRLKYLGYDPNEVLQQFDAELQAMQQEAERQRATQYGVSPELLQEIQRLKEMNEQLMLAEARRRIEAEEQQLKQMYQDYDNYVDQIYEIARQKGLSLKEAYILASYEDKIKQAQLQAEQQALADVMGRSQKQVQSTAIGQPPATKNAWDLGKKDFAKLIEEVKMGRRVNL